MDCSRDALLREFPSLMICSQRGQKRFPVAMAAGIHPFPSRTRKLSSPAPMVLGGRPPGRVGRRRNISRKPPARRAGGFYVCIRVFVLFRHTVVEVVALLERVA